jgi:demethylmenaquinone methyltransferase / 2-methoxy-6-polyprenyl-1,4-benzoquinol methylase
MTNQTKKSPEKLSGHERADAVQDVFQRIAPRYDLMNRLMTGGQDRAWRRFVIQKAAIPAGGQMLDIATGTGDIAFEALNGGAGVAIGADFAPAMMLAGRRRPMGERVRWVTADALNLPFPDASFDAVTHGYLLRNVIDIPRALLEQFRVVRPGGRMVCLDTSPPPPSLVRPFVLIHLNFIIPTLGTILTGQRDAYKYLPESTKGFKSPEELAELMRAAGFVDVQFKRFVFGTMAVHWGTRPG